jgi:hypothetical protein
MNSLLSIVDDALVIKKLNVREIDGPVTANDDVQVQGSIYIDKDIKSRRNLDVAGVITADTIRVNNIISDSAGADKGAATTVFTGKTEKDLDGKGLLFTDGNGSKQFVFKEGNRLWSTMDIDLARGRSYQIDRIPVLSSTTLGSTVVNSNLTKVGELNGLRVSGQVEFDNWVFFNSYNNRMGINTENPNATFSLLDNNVEIILGSFESDVAFIGTFNSSSVDFGTDHKTRMSIKNTGEVIFGNPKYKNANVKIHGRLEVDELVSNIKEKNLPITFKTNETSNVYGTGFLWQHEQQNHQFVFSAGPERITSTETIDLSEGKWFSIGKMMVLSNSTLGSSVTDSSLTKLGALRSLTVEGPADFQDLLKVNVLNTGLLSSDQRFAISCNSETEFKIVSNGNIEIGHHDNPRRKVIVYGQLNLNSVNTDSDVDLALNESMSINGKKFQVANRIPTSGQSKKGDIVWNDNPTVEGYIGWVCVKEGTPGNWAPFGRIYTDRQ